MRLSKAQMLLQKWRLTVRQRTKHQKRRTNFQNLTHTFPFLPRSTSMTAKGLNSGPSFRVILLKDYAPSTAALWILCLPASTSTTLCFSSSSPLYRPHQRHPSSLFGHIYLPHFEPQYYERIKILARPSRHYYFGTTSRHPISLKLTF